MIDHTELLNDMFEYSKIKLSKQGGLFPFAIFITGNDITPLFLTDVENPHDCQIKLFEFAAQIQCEAVIFSSLVVLSKYEERDGYSIDVKREVLLTQYSTHTSDFSKIIQGNIKVHSNGIREVVQTRIHNKVDITESQKFLQSI